MKKTGLFILCAVLAISALAFSVRPEKAEAAAAGVRNIFQYDTYEAGGYYEINYYLDINGETAEEINNKCGGASVNGKDGIDKLFNSIEEFFYAYEALFFNRTSETYFRRASVEAYSSFYPYHSFNMYIFFQTDDEKTASEKYNKYFGYADGEPMEPTKTGFFADKYEIEDITHFFVPAGMPDNGNFRSNDYYYKDIRGLASLNAVMMPFLLYGNVNNTGFADIPGIRINYRGLVNIFQDYFTDRDKTRAGIFSDYILYHSMSASTAYLRTDADEKETGFGGEYMHKWKVSYTDSSYNPNRIINITYIEPKIINMYFFAMIIAVSFIALLLFCFYGLPKIVKKEKTP